jgi:phosphoenolpyruvate synthase/pyruvate phosphate dikinase
MRSWLSSREGREKKKVFALTEGSASDERLLSPKFASLCELWKLGLGTPAGFILSTTAAHEGFVENG